MVISDSVEKAAEWRLVLLDVSADAESCGGVAGRGVEEGEEWYPVMEGRTAVTIVALLTG